MPRRSDHEIRCAIAGLEEAVGKVPDCAHITMALTMQTNALTWAMGSEPCNDGQKAIHDALTYYAKVYAKHEDN